MSQKLPIGIQSFEKLRTEDYAYIDKTALLYNLVRKGGYYFISRPRRFGKSLLVSAVHAYFEGRKDLFQSLAIEQIEKEWQSYPVLHIDLNVGEYALREVLSEKLTYILSDFERQYGLTSEMSSIAGDLRRNIDKRLVNEFMRQLKAMLAGIPYESDKNVELNYKNLLFLVFTLLGCKPQVERPVSSGRIDLVLERREYVYVFEFKLDKDAETALGQIDNKHYTDAYATDRRQVVKIGVNFSEKLKNIEDWKMMKMLG